MEAGEIMVESTCLPSCGRQDRNLTLVIRIGCERWWCSTHSLELDKIIQNRNGMLMSSHQDTRKNRMRLSTRLGSVAAIGFADDHGWTNHAFGLIVGIPYTVTNCAF